MKKKVVLVMSTILVCGCVFSACGQTAGNEGVGTNINETDTQYVEDNESGKENAGNKVENDTMWLASQDFSKGHKVSEGTPEGLTVFGDKMTLTTVLQYIQTECIAGMDTEDGYEEKPASEYLDSDVIVEWKDSVQDSYTRLEIYEKDTDAPVFAYSDLFAVVNVSGEDTTMANCIENGGWMAKMTDGVEPFEVYKLLGYTDEQVENEEGNYHANEKCMELLLEKLGTPTYLYFTTLSDPEGIQYIHFSDGYYEYDTAWEYDDYVLQLTCCDGFRDGESYYVIRAVTVMPRNLWDMIKEENQIPIVWN